METSAKANINVENVRNCLALMNSECFVYRTEIILPLFPFVSQAFLTLARDIKSKMDTKLVGKLIYIYCNCIT